MSKPSRSVPSPDASAAGGERVLIENVNHPGRTSTGDAAMYHAMRAALLKALPAQAPGLTLAEAREALAEHLPAHLFPGGAKAGWWFKTVQLDLEAKGVVAREPSKPLRLHRKP